MEPPLQLNIKVLFAPTSYTKMLGRDERRLNSCYPYTPCCYSHPRTPFKLCVLDLKQIKNEIHISFSFLYLMTSLTYEMK